MGKTSTVKVESYHPPTYVFWNLGSSVEGRELKALAIGPHTDTSVNSAACDIPYQPGEASFPWILFLGGIYGDEPAAAALVRYAWEHWVKHFEYRLLGIALWDRINPDGLEHGTRLNAHGVDVNRNLPTRDWQAGAQKMGAKAGTSAACEPEAKALADLVAACRPKSIVVAREVDKPYLAYSGAGRPVAAELSKFCDYPVIEAKPIPGSLDVLAGKQKFYPVITLGIPRGLTETQVIERHMGVLEQTLNYWDSRV